MGYWHAIRFVSFRAFPGGVRVDILGFVFGFAADLVRWFQLCCLDGPLAIAEPNTLRWQLWHAPARLIRRARQQVVRVLDGWPTADAIVNAYRNIALLT